MPERHARLQRAYRSHGAAAAGVPHFLHLRLGENTEESVPAVLPIGEQSDRPCLLAHRGALAIERALPDALLVPEKQKSLWSRRLRIFTAQVQAARVHDQA